MWYLFGNTNSLQAVVNDWADTSAIYHEFRSAPNTTTSTAVRSEFLINEPKQLQKLRFSVFGCRNYPVRYSNCFPNISPLGNRQAILSVGRVFQSNEDYILPLAFDEQDRHHLVKQNYYDNWYFVGIYIREKDIEPHKPILKWLGLLDWILNWKIGDHPYLRLTPDYDIQYLVAAWHAPLWYQILVPYEVQLPKDEIVWNSVTDTQRWHPEWGREVTDYFTLVVMRLCFRNIYIQYHSGLR